MPAFFSRAAAALGLSASLASAVVQKPDHCTAFAAGRLATADGSTYVGQSGDAEGGPGTSLLFVPAADHEKGSSRPVYDQATGKEIGSIPQVPHTYAYTYAMYGIMNEHQLAFGESTCSGRITASSLANNGTALFSNKELSMIALERCTTARCAIKLMGDLAENHGGFYGEDVAVDTGAENLVVADPAEAWIFHILADPTGRSAIWAAQRVPDENVTYVPNTFVIRAMDLASDDFMLSSNARDIAQQFGWWDGHSIFNFAEVYGLGEYNNPFYSARRMWRAYDLLAPSLKLDPKTEITIKDAGYPFSVKPDKLLMAADFIRVYRDYYEGTPFSLVADSIAAGPFNSPLRIAGADAEGAMATGAWERPISIFRTDYTVVSSCGSSTAAGLVRFAPKTAHASIFTPAWTSRATEVPRAFAVDPTKSVDRDSIFWAVSAVSNWAFGTMFSHAIVDIRQAQAKLEQQFETVAKQLQQESDGATVTSLLEQAAKTAHSEWWDLFFELMGKYNDGYIITRDEKRVPTAKEVGYPKWWLDAAGFDKALQAPSASFQALKHRMQEAEAVMKQIEANRTHAQVFGHGFIV